MLLLALNEINMQGHNIISGTMFILSCIKIDQLIHKLNWRYTADSRKTNVFLVWKQRRPESRRHYKMCNSVC